ncbi:hypothetical protein [Hymenobacter sp. B1770]|uniref:hypothetical protein n=1 Tax=Hymenobacter sp. B1770 TaxID=1718788 RepID=UPI003CEE7AB3
MYQLSSLIRRLTAVTFLVTYLSVFAGQAFCTSSADPWAKDGVAACCVGKPCASAGKSAVETRNTKAPKGLDCNKRGIARLLAEQASPQGHFMGIHAPAVLPEPAFTLVIPRFTNWPLTQKVALEPTRYLKPKIPDIRIYIRSLTV